jgi:hypothetical protein
MKSQSKKGFLMLSLKNNITLIFTITKIFMAWLNGKNAVAKMAFMKG